MVLFIDNYMIVPIIVHPCAKIGTDLRTELKFYQNSNLVLTYSEDFKKFY